RTTSSYDPVGQVVAVQDADNQVSTTVYDAVGQTIATVNPLLDRTTSIYDAAGQTVAQINERGFRYTSTYDAAGQEVVTIDPLNRHTTYTYNAVGNRQTRIDARGNVTTYVYDPRNLPTQRQYPDGSRATFVYNALGDRTVMANQSERSTTTYDPLRRRESVVTAVGKRITYTYDAVGRNSQMTVLDAGVFTYAYDANSQLTLIQNPQGARTSFSYDAAGRQTVKELANGTKATVIYDAAGQVTRTTNLKSDDEVICQFDYTYDPIGNKQTITTADGSLTTYSYDATSQLTEEWRTSSTLNYRNTFLWDATGNRVLTIKDGDRTTSTFDAANQNVFSDSSAGRTTYTFDADGSRTCVEAPDGSRTTTTYDDENRDVLIVLPSGVRNTMAYDSDGLRVQVDNSAGTTKFVYNNQQYLLETDGSNILTAVYTQQPGNYSNLTSQYRFNGSLWLPSYSHYDSLGSTAALTDADETVTDTYIYDAWGERLNSTGATINPFQWLGRVGYYHNADTGLVYVIMRTYSPVTGTWTTLDILRFVDGMNMYKAYFVPGGLDPSGLQPDPWSDPWRGGYYGGPAYQPWQPLERAVPATPIDLSGPFIWLLTGEWSSNPDAVIAAGEQFKATFMSQLTCLGNCVLSGNKQVISVVAGATTAGAYAGLQCQVPPRIGATMFSSVSFSSTVYGGEGNPTVMSYLGEKVGKMGSKNPNWVGRWALNNQQKIHAAVRHLPKSQRGVIRRRFITREAIKLGCNAVVVVESVIAIACSYQCYRSAQGR
ncbi:MAG: RHS repeat protein, partial [Planctomycetaceae bacterium]|nr:RHS repeat protein [Planctomycetaceae bacterium]